MLKSVREREELNENRPSVTPPKASKEASKLGVGFSLSPPTDLDTFSVQIPTWLPYSELYPRGDTSSRCLLGLRISEDLQRQVSALDFEQH